MDFVIDWARTVLDSTKDSPLWLELIFYILGALGFFVAVLLLVLVVTLPFHLYDRWRWGR